LSRSSDAANAVVYTAIQTCALYGVKTMRMQSRVMWVPGAAGRPRPMFFGKWTDDNGVEHNGGMADLLARPRIDLQPPHALDPVEATLLLWIECKSGKGRLTEDQIAFKNHVENNGEFYIVCHDDMRPLVGWLEAHGLKERNKR
jgi:hypothetical protein